MTVELWVLLDPTKQLSEINLALARGQMFFIAPVNSVRHKFCW